MEISYGGIPGRPIGDGMDGHSWWPLFTNIPTEYLESYCPLRVDRYASVTDSGGAGLHRGGNGIDKWYTFLEPGEIAIHDDRWLTPPWGILGGKPGMRSTKILVRTDGSRTILPSKCDQIKVEPGDQLIFQTAGGGGWGDPLQRPVEQVHTDVLRELVSLGKARSDYGVIIDPQTQQVNEAATTSLREKMTKERGPRKTFDFGPPLPELLARCKEETGLEPPTPPKLPPGWATNGVKKEAA
jgi:N-methylhydantoinase B